MMILANVGIPMIFPQFILMAFAFVPIVLVEAFVVRRLLGHPFGGAVRDTAIANLWTTFIGVPLAWGVMFVLELVSTGGTAWGLATPATRLAAVTLQAAWLVPYEKHLNWMVPAASVVLLFPSFVLSVLLERRVLASRWITTERAIAYRTSFRANLASYVLLFLAGLIWFFANTK